MQFVFLPSAFRLPATMPDDTGGVVQPGVHSWFGRFLPKRGNGVQDPSTGGVEGGEKMIRTERGSQAVQGKKLWVIESSSKFIGSGGSDDTPLTGWSKRFADWLGRYQFKNNREMIWDCSLRNLFEGNWEPEWSNRVQCVPKMVASFELGCIRQLILKLIQNINTNIEEENAHKCSPSGSKSW